MATQPTIEELMRAFSVPSPDFDPRQISQGAIAGGDLAATILARKQGQEDRSKKLADEIARVKKQRSLTGEISKRSPLAGKASDLIPDEAAKQILQLEFDEKGKQQAKNERPDNIKQILQVGDRTIGVTYGGQIKDIPLGGRAEPLVRPSLPAAESRGLSELGQVAEKLKQAKAIFDKSVTRDPVSGRTTSDSPLVGVVDNVLARANEFTGNPDTDTTTFRTLVTNNINQQIKAITGAQLSEAEAQRIMKALPSMNLNTAAFDQRLQDAIKITEDIIKEKQAAFSAGYSNVPNVLAPGNAAPAAPAGNPGQPAPTRQFKVIGRRPSGSQ